MLSVLTALNYINFIFFYKIFYLSKKHYFYKIRVFLITIDTRHFQSCLFCGKFIKLINMIMNEIHAVALVLFSSTFTGDFFDLFYFLLQKYNRKVIPFTFHPNLKVVYEKISFLSRFYNPLLYLYLTIYILTKNMSKTIL